MKCEFIEGNNAEKPIKDVLAFVDGVVAPSLEAMEKAIQTKKVTGGIASGEREGYFLINASSHKELSDFLRSLPFARTHFGSL